MVLDCTAIPPQGFDPSHSVGLAVTVGARDEAEELAARYGGDTTPLGHRRMFVVRLPSEGAAAYLRSLGL